MAEYPGTALIVQWNGTVLPQVLSAIPDQSGDTPRLDKTHATDTSSQYLDDLPDTPQVTIPVRGWLESGTAASVIRSISVGDSGTLVIGDQGTAAGYPSQTASSASIIRKVTGDNFRQPQPYEISFRQNTAALTEGTFSA